MIIDSHSHVVLPTECQLFNMDEAGIDRTILFATSVHPESADTLSTFEQEMQVLFEIVSGKRNLADSKIASIQELAAVTSRYPERFTGFGWVPSGEGYTETASWIEQYILANRFAGLGELTPAPGEIGKLANIFAAAADFGKLPLWIHTFFPLTLSDLREIFGLAEKFPSVTVIIGHLAGTNWLEVIRQAKIIPNLMLDLSAVYTVMALKFAISELPERCLFSVDAPYGDPLLARQTIERVCPDPTVRKMVLGENIAQLLHL